MPLPPEEPERSPKVAVPNLFGDLDDLPQFSEPTPAWHPDVRERLKVLLHAEPLFRLLRADAHLERASDLGHYDSLALAFKIFDEILESTGLDHELDMGGIGRALSPLLTWMDAAKGIAPDPERHERMVQRVVDWLLNEAERREPFAVGYMDFDDGRAIRREMDVVLMTERFTPGGGSVPRLSNAATNLYLNALDLDIEDQQVAIEAVLRAQIDRGRFAEAVRSARAALLLSVQLRDKIEGILRETRRDVRRVDWGREVPQILEAARVHLRERTATERMIVSSAEEKLNHLAADSAGAKQVAQVVQLIDRCYKRHTDLADRLIGANPLFLDEQARQAFASSRGAAAPDLIRDVLGPYLRLPKSVGTTLSSAVLSAFAGAVVPPVFSLGAYVDWLLQPRRETRAHTAPITERDVEEMQPEALRFDQETWDAADAYLAQVSAPVSLSALLAQAEADGAPPSVRHLAALRALFLFAPNEISPGDLRAEKTDETFTHGVFYGDNLILSRGEATDGRPA